MVLIEVVGGLVPVLAVVELVAVGLVVAVGILGESIVIVVEDQPLVERVVTAQALLVEVFVGIHAVGYESGVVVTAGNTAPYLSCSCQNIAIALLPAR